MKQEKLNKLRAVALRILPVITAAVILVISLTAPASAAVLDPYDYANVVVDGDTENLTVYFPDTLSQWLQLYKPDGSSSYQTIQHVTGNYIANVVTEDQADNNLYHYYPFGYGNVFASEGIPSSTTFGTFCDIFYYQNSPVTAAYTVSVQFRLRTYDKDMNLISNDIVATKSQTVDTEPADYRFSFQHSDMDTSAILSAAYFNFYYIVYTSGTDQASAELITLEAVSDFYMNMSISALYKQQQLTGKTNELLEEVKDQLEEQSKTLDEILSGSQEDQDAAQDFQDQLEDQKEEVKDAENTLDDALDVDTTQVNNWIIQLMVNLDIPYAQTLGLFWENQLLHDLLLMASIFALVSFVLFGKKG